MLVSDYPTDPNFNPDPTIFFPKKKRKKKEERNKQKTKQMRKQKCDLADDRQSLFQA
jgi:hypothetical protein